MATSPRRVPQIKTPRRIGENAATAGVHRYVSVAGGSRRLLGWPAIACGLLGFFVPWTTLGDEQDATDERSVLISSRKSERQGGGQPTPTSDATTGLEEPLAPVAVATDQQPKLATPPAEGIPNQPTAEPADSQRATPSPGLAEPLPPAADAPLAGQQETTADSAQIETAKFNGVQPGTTTIAQLRQAWGEPGQRVQDGGLSERWIYQINPFKAVQVDVESDDETNVVRSIELELKQQVDPSQLARQLRLDRFRPASIRDAQGTELGVIYPERGVVFSYAPSSDEAAISHVLLEPVSAAAFLLRAEQDLHGPYTENLRDLNAATSLDPQLSRAWWQLAGIELATGRFSAAEVAAKSAVDADPSNAEYRLRWAASLAQLDKHAEAVTQTRRIAESPDAPPHVRAEALVQLARLQSIVPAPGQEAIKLYQEAIEIAGELSMSQETEIRRAAKSVLISAHLGVAQEIAHGQWRDKESVVPQWLERASAFAEDMVRSESAGEEVRLQVAIGALEALGAFPPSAGPGEWVREAQTAIEALLAKNDDELWKGRIHWEAGQAYLHAIRVEHARGKADDALLYGQTAIAHFRDGARLREASPLGEHLVGRLYFHLGAVHAIHYQDHERAVVWYEKAAPLLVRSTPQVPGADWRIHGDALVSMGVSYWESGARDRALKLTQWGADLLQAGVEAAALDQAMLSVAYGNLANMHKLLGNEGEADRFIEIAERVQTTSRQ